MAQDPAFLLYASDFLTGTQFFTDEQVGKYIRLLCTQKLSGPISEKHMLHICKTHDPELWEKFQKNNDGKFFNVRLAEVIEKREKYAESRRNNRLNYRKNIDTKPVTKTKGDKNISLSYDNHMENENENENVIINENKDAIKNESKTVLNEKKAAKRFEVFKTEVSKYIDDYSEEMIDAFARYWSELNSPKTKMRFELEKTFEIKKRLVTWSENNNRFNNNTPRGISPKKTTKAEAASDRLDDVLKDYEDDTTK